MNIRNATGTQIAQAAELSGVVLSNVRERSATVHDLTLVLNGRGKWQRYSSNLWPGQTRRKVHAVCWHGYYAFMDELTKLAPDAIIQSSLDKYVGRAGFLENAEDSGDRNVGSKMYPCAYRDACNCEREAVS